MKLSRIDYIGLNGNDGLHYEEEIVMSMTRKDFEAIAHILREKGLVIDHKETIYELANDLARYFKQANPSFDKVKFIRACGWYQD